jgi:hypothetical protein
LRKTSDVTNWRGTIFKMHRAWSSTTPWSPNSI